MRVTLALAFVAALVGAACAGSNRQPEFEFSAPTPSSTLEVGASAPAEGSLFGTSRPPIASGGCGLVQAAGERVASVQSPDGVRSYRIHVPAGFAASRPAPVVVNFHGWSKTALEQEAYSGLVAVADREGFILVTPEGSGSPQQWEVFGVYPDAGIGDVAVTATIVRAMKTNFCVDEARVYATGLSNGAEMASGVGCLLPDVFAAVAPVAGVVYEGCGGRPMPVVSFHGTEDYNVPFDTARPAMAGWAGHNGCSTAQQIVQVTEHVSRESYLDCGGADVVLYIVEGGGHTWPGAEDNAGGAGPTTHEIDASNLIWDFFAAHPMP